MCVAPVLSLPRARVGLSRLSVIRSLAFSWANTTADPAGTHNSPKRTLSSGTPVLKDSTWPWEAENPVARSKRPCPRGWTASFGPVSTSSGGAWNYLGLGRSRDYHCRRAQRGSAERAHPSSLERADRYRRILLCGGRRVGRNGSGLARGHGSHEAV
jgi:hypothetical protein